MRSEISAIAPSSGPPVRESDERSSGRETEACGEAKPSRDDIDDSSSGDSLNVAPRLLDDQEVHLGDSIRYVSVFEEGTHAPLIRWKKQGF